MTLADRRASAEDRNPPQDAADLATQVRKAVEGEMRFDPGSGALVGKLAHGSPGSRGESGS